ncbi:hypothetical protein CVV68_13275 [Arthrobacter livingstonensis]|uniref:Uncharacterized protein n=2 Tax=Arthrobacter livingstonensis TaxID=670078 RepID=A0A2V5L5R8_9MICC|nr:hypothetical protein CVV68_13275 [Arthrobacter livingstonensis]
MNGAKLGSGFQNRSLEGDLNSTLFPTIAKLAPRTDLFIMDLTDERLGAFALPDGTYITHSVELQKSGRLSLLPKIPTRLNVGGDRHFALWTRAAIALKSVLLTQGLFETTLVLRMPWATHTFDGEVVEPFRHIPTSEMNQMFKRYFAKLEHLGFYVVSPPPSLALSDANHKWGPAPFHYIDAAYTSLLGAIDGQLNSKSTQA